jgi:hypothetical protein
VRRLTLAGLVSNLCKLVAGVSVRTLDRQKLGLAVFNTRRNRIPKVGCAAYILNGLSDYDIRVRYFCFF